LALDSSCPFARPIHAFRADHPPTARRNGIFRHYPELDA